MDFVGGTEEAQKPVVENTQLDLDRTRQDKRDAGGLRQGYRHSKWVYVIGYTVYTCVCILVVITAFGILSVPS